MPHVLGLSYFLVPVFSVSRVLSLDLCLSFSLSRSARSSPRLYRSLPCFPWPLTCAIAVVSCRLLCSLALSTYLVLSCFCTHSSWSCFCRLMVNAVWVVVVGLLGPSCCLVAAKGHCRVLSRSWPSGYPTCSGGASA